MLKKISSVVLVLTMFFNPLRSFAALTEEQANEGAQSVCRELGYPTGFSRYEKILIIPPPSFSASASASSASQVPGLVPGQVPGQNAVQVSGPVPGALPAPQRQNMENNPTSSAAALPAAGSAYASSSSSCCLASGPSSYGNNYYFVNFGSPFPTHYHHHYYGGGSGCGDFGNCGDCSGCNCDCGSCGSCGSCDGCSGCELPEGEGAGIAIIVIAAVAVVCIAGIVTYLIYDATKKSRLEYRKRVADGAAERARDEAAIKVDALIDGNLVRYYNLFCLKEDGTSILPDLTQIPGVGLPAYNAR